MKKLIKDCTIITMMDHDQPYVGDILIEDDIIMDIGSNLQTEADEEIQGAGMVAMPGLINAHNHSPMSLLRGFSDDLILMDWLEKKMLPAEARMNEEDIY